MQNERERDHKLCHQERQMSFGILILCNISEVFRNITQCNLNKHSRLSRGLAAA
jgi:hypothetical protein